MEEVNAYFVSKNKEEVMEKLNTEYTNKIAIKMGDEYLIVDIEDFYDSVEKESKDKK